MKQNFEAALAHLLSPDIEGGFSNHPDDPGGITNLGVTLRTWEEWVGRPVTEKEMRELTPAKVAPLYKKKYWDRVLGDELPSGLDALVFDTAVNSGPGRAIKFLQGCLGVDMDGSFGPRSKAALAKANIPQVISDYAKRRLSYLHDLPTWDTFGRGWARRVALVEKFASTMNA